MDRTLTRELVDQIVFGMENQEQQFFLDLETMEVVPMEDVVDPEEDAQRFVPLPEWQSVDGFNLMERFVQNLHNPLARTELQQILLSGRGVFRQFKNCLRQYPEVAKRWYRFKETQMRDLVAEWYSEVMETAGLEYVEPEFEDTEDLVLDDFELILGNGPELAESESLAELDLDALEARCLAELYPESSESEFWRWLRETDAEAGQVDLATRADCVLAVLLTPTGEAAGYLRLQTRPLESGERWAVVRRLYVVPEYRGLGAAKTIVDKVLEKRTDLGISRIVWDLPGSCAFLYPFVESVGFVPWSTGFLLI